jgi:hypothetical protein
MFLRYLAVAAASAATIIVVSAVYLEKSITVSEAYARVSGMLFRIFFIMVGLGIGVIIGFVLLIVPGIILMLMWALAIPVAVLEDAGLGDALSRSRYLTKDHRWRVFAIFLLYFVLIFSMELAIGGVVAAVVALKGIHITAASMPTAFSVLGLVIGFLAACFITPVLTICLSLMYYDERVRKEAFDIHLMMGALGEGPAGSESAAATV